MTLFRKEALEHKRRKLHGEVILVQPIGFFIMTAVMFAVTMALVFFLMTGEYKRKETVAGYISSSNGVSIIRADQGGRLAQVYVNEGDYIEAGAPLFESRIDVETAEGLIGERRLESVDVRLSELNEQVTNIEKRYRQDETRFRSQLDNFTRELEGLKRRRDLQQKAVDFAENNLKKYERLTEDEITSQLELDQVRSNNINQKIALEGIIQQIVSREGTIGEIRHNLRGMNTSKERELSQLRVQISQLEDTKTGLEASTQYMVRSPVAGRVAALQGSVGQSVAPATPVVMIIPEGSDLIAPVRRQH